MKSVALLATVAAVFSLVSASAFAAPDAEAAQKYAKDNGCTKCHAVDKTKKGPPYTKTAAKFKGKADAEAKLLHHLTSGEMVKFDDGKEEEHKVIKTKDKAAIKNLTDWILSLGK